MIKTFWLILSLACIGWYITVLGYVVVKGGVDIRHMLRRLSDGDSTAAPDEEA